MILADREILQALKDGRIKITPEPDLQQHLGSCSIDFRLGDTFMVFEHSRFSYIDPRQPQSIGAAMRTIVVPEDEPFIMQAGDFALASTMESLELPDDLLGRLEGRSSIARLGITVHSTAAVFEPGWVGTATMELSNSGRMAVGPLSRHADLLLHVRAAHVSGACPVSQETGQQIRRAGRAARQRALRRDG